MKEAIGMIETRGVLATVEALDVMLKTANVSTVEKIRVGGGLTCIIIRGEVAAVSTSVEAAEAAVKRLGDSLVGRHVIPRPDDQLEILFDDLPDPPSTEMADKMPEKTPEISDTDLEKDISDTSIEPQNTTKGIDIKQLNQMRVIDLRNLARQYEDFPIQGRDISNANKKTLLAYFKEYFQ
ncbi:MAG: BMC domain-containing protein [Clostridiales bacterium]|nr:BMC domain-containing protein [Clostridiales bacterium]